MWAPDRCEPGADPAWLEIPEHLRGGLKRYIDDRTLPGRFLTAVLSNDLAGAVLCAADPLTLFHLRTLCQFFHTYAPCRCHGSSAAVEAWIAPNPNPQPRQEPSYADQSRHQDAREENRS